MFGDILYGKEPKVDALNSQQRFHQQMEKENNTSVAILKFVLPFRHIFEGMTKCLEDIFIETFADTHQDVWAPLLLYV